VGSAQRTGPTAHCPLIQNVLRYVKMNVFAAQLRTGAMNLADLIRWSFMPDSNHALLNTSNQILQPDAWMTLFWKVMGCIFITFATSHGLHGLLNVLEDYNTIPWLRRTLRILGLVLTVVMIAIGIYVLWTS